MSDDSDHAASPEQRAKRQRTNQDIGLPPILAFDSMGPDDTTTEFIYDTEEHSKEMPSPMPGTGPVIQTTEDIGRLQMENVRLRVELDELRKQLHELQQSQQQQQQQQQQQGNEVSTDTGEAEARIELLERELASVRAENDRLVKHASDSRMLGESEAADHKQIEQDKIDLEKSNNELLEVINGLKETKTTLQQSTDDLRREKIQIQEQLQSETQHLKSIIDDLQAKVQSAERDDHEQEQLRLRISSLEKELHASHALQPRIDELEAANTALQLTLERKQEQMISMQHHTDADSRLNDENEELKDMLVDLGVRDHERAHELETLSAAKDKLTSKLADTEAQLEAARTESHQRAAKVLALETDAKSAEMQIKDISHRVHILEESVELKESQNTELRDEVHRFTIRDQEQAEMIQHLNLQQGHIKRLNEDFKQRVASQDINITEQRAEIRSLHRQCTEQAHSLEELQRERNELETLSQSRAQALEDRERQIKELYQKTEQLKAALSQLEEAVAAKSEQIERQAEAAWQQRRAADDELKRIQNEHSHEVETLKHEHNSELANQLGMQQRIIDDVKSREVENSEKYEKQLQKLRAQVASLRADTATFESENNTAKALLDDTRAQLNQTLQSLEDLQARSSEERSRHASEKQRLERHSGELEARTSRLLTELDELRRKDKAMDERIQKLEQTLVDQSVELGQLKTPPSSDVGHSSSVQSSISEIESMRREFSTQNALWERMRDEMAEYINRINGENSSLRSELERWQHEESQRVQAMEDSLKRKFIKQAEQLESLASFKEDAQNSLVSVAQEDVRKLTQENLAMRREQAALYERAETLEIHANQASAEVSRTNERLHAITAQLKAIQEEDEHIRLELQRANELVVQSQNRATDLENELNVLHERHEQKLAEMQSQLDQLKTALQASDATAKNLRINNEVLESQYKSQAESAVKYVDMLFFIMKVDRRRIQDLTFVKKHLMLYFPPPVGVFPIKGEHVGERRRIRTMHDAATFALAVVRFRRGRRSGSRVLALEYEKQLRTMQ